MLNEFVVMSCHVVNVVLDYLTSVAKAMKVLRKLGCCLQIEVGIV